MTGQPRTGEGCGVGGGRPAKTVQTVGLLMTYYKTTIWKNFAFAKILAIKFANVSKVVKVIS